MKFVGSTIIYSYLQAIGIIYSHDKECFMYKENELEENETMTEFGISEFSNKIIF